MRKRAAWGDADALLKALKVSAMIAPRAQHSTGPKAAQPSLVISVGSQTAVPCKHGQSQPLLLQCAFDILFETSTERTS